MRSLPRLAVYMLAVMAVLVQGASPSRAEPGSLDPPAPLHIAAVFDRPDSDWGPGHRGVDLWMEPGGLVRSPGNGVVTFAGDVAGRGVVVVRHPSGLRSTLEPVTATVRVGDAVSAGQAVGTLESVGSHCAPRTCLHWGIRRGDVYVDPLDVLRGFGPIRLLPLRDDYSNAPVLTRLSRSFLTAAE